MPEKATLARVKRDKRQGKAPTTQAGEFVREEIDHIREGKHGATSAKQAIAIGLSKARRAGVKLPPPPAAKRRTRRSATHASRAAASRRALAQQAKAAARHRSSAARRAAARRASRTKGAKGRRMAARKAARTRQLRRVARRRRASA